MSDETRQQLVARTLAEIDEIEVDIEKLVAGGDGFARFRGVPIFVPRSAPGDRLRVRLTERRSHYGRTGHRYPPVIRNVPDSWRPVFSFLRQTTGIRQSVAYALASLEGGGLISATLAAEMDDKLERWSHTRPVTIYAVN